MKSAYVLHAGALGDLVLTAHVVCALRRLIPNHRWTVAARCPLAPWMAAKGVFDRAADIESLQLHALYRPGGRVVEDNPLRAADLVVSFLGPADNALARNLAASVRGRVVAISPNLTPATRRGRRHITDQWADAILDAMGVRVDVAAEEPLVTAHLGDRPKAQPLVICHPGSGGRSKNAPLEWFEGIVSRVGEMGMRATWMIGPAEREWYGPSFIERLARSAPVIEEHDLPTAADRLADADAFVGNDAGMTHLAAGLGLKTAALFGPTDERVWRPLGPKVTTIHFDSTTGCNEAGSERPAIDEILAFLTSR